MNDALSLSSSLAALLLLAGLAGAQDADESPVPAPSGSAAAAAPQVAGSVQNLALLHDNGPYITGIGNGAGGADTSAIEPGFTTFGYACQLSATADFRVADDFSVPTGQTWTLTSMSWKGYQTGAPTSGTLTSANVRVWSGSPAAGGTVLAGDTTTNRMTGAAWSGVYRTGSAGPGDISRAIMDVTVDMSWVPPLSAGSYWVDVQLTGTLNSGPWSNPTVPAQPTDNALQFSAATGMWAPVDDNMSLAPQDFPYTLDGVGGCPGGSTYCTAKVSSSGCVPSISTSGTPTPSGGFTVICNQAGAGQLGVFIYGQNGPAAIAFQGGFLCVQPPVLRLPPQNSGGAGACTGVFTYNLAGLVTSLPAGSTVNGQFWFRDPAAMSGSGLSNGVMFTTCP